MPLYTYRAVDPQHACDECRDSLELFQKMSEPNLTQCPNCHAPVVRFMHPVATVRDSSVNKTLSDDNLKKHGFKKLRNVGGGKFDEVV